MEGGAGLDETADFDEYTIYDQGTPGVIPNITPKNATGEQKGKLGVPGGRSKKRYASSSDISGHLFFKRIIFVYV